MFKAKIFVPFLVALGSLVLILLWPAATPAPLPAAEKNPVKILTRTDSLIMRFDTLIQAKIDSMGLVGGALVITVGDSVVYERCFGVKETGTADSVDIHTIFRLASVSKTMTGVLAGILSEDKIINLNDHVSDYLQGLKLKEPSYTNLLTIQNLLSHTSGLAPHAYDNLVESGVPMRTIIDSLQRVNIAGAPGQFYGYQNVVFSLYDTIVRIKTGTPFHVLIHDRLFIPFGMTDASAGLNGFATSTNRALPHARNGRGYRMLKENDRYYSTIPAAGINASISDMGNFLLVLNGSRPGVFTPSMADTIFTPRIKTALKWSYLRHWDKVDSKAYGTGWRIIGYRGHRIAYHGGYVDGYHSEVALCRDQRIGIAWLTNSPGSIGSEAVPMFLDMYFDQVQGN